MKRNVQVPKQIREAFEKKLAECVMVARKKSGNQNIPIFPLIFRQCGSRAGICRISVIEPTIVYINPDFFKTNYDEQLNDTLPHEVAHGIAHALWPDPFPAPKGFRSDPHGRNWERVMNWFGISNPNRTHKMDMSGVATRQVNRPFTYLCGCKLPHKLTLRMHTMIQVHGRSRTCRGCKQRIVYQRGGKPVSIDLTVERVTPKVMLVTMTPKPPEPKPTHRTITQFVNGTLQNVRVPLTPEELAVV
jgi:SprT protein